ncbi:sensor histidine kinase [Rubeoparvulum massiliense]|uniref:sensor histidine kinase n=1 Tax=Rubeoparvulum massiliense TaxID=1631346 RepID=UPI00065E4380|nr:sensor histidine kinase [Rubeoparvulum massiliense]
MEITLVILASLNAVLLIWIGLQSARQKARSKNLSYISHKIEGLIAEHSNEKLLLVTEDHELKRLLVAMNHLLDHQHALKAQHLRMEESMRKMLANTSHDMKTPLTVILGYLEMIRLDPMISIEERGQLMVKVESKAGEVLALINRFFDLAKLEAKDTEISITRVLMNEICRTNILTYYDLVTAKGIEVSIEIPDFDLYAWGNEDVLARIMNNLISNALNHGADGKRMGVTLRADERFVYVDVWDQGKGIAETHLDHVFERMYTLEDSRNKLYQGSGLGLTITKRLVEQLGGTIHLESKPYEKTVFTICLRRFQY